MIFDWNLITALQVINEDEKESSRSSCDSDRIYQIEDVIDDDSESASEEEKEEEEKKEEEDEETKEEEREPVQV